MKPRTVLILAVLAVFSLGAGWFLGVAPARALRRPDVPGGVLAFPGLTAKLQAAARVEIEHHGKTVTIALHDGHWGVAGRGFYPVAATRLHTLLDGLTELRLMERRTADKALLERLGLGDPESATSAATLLSVLDAKGKVLAALVLGHSRVHAGGDGGGEIYVRRPGADQSWLAKGDVDADGDPAQWLDRDIADIKAPRIAAVTVERTGERLELARQDGGDHLALTAPKAHKALDQSKLDDVAHALESLSFIDVRPGPLPGARVGTATFRTTDGVAIVVTVNRDGKAIWAGFAPSGGAGAKGLAKRVSGWAYRIEDWKEAALVPSLDQLTAEPATKAGP